MGLGGHLIQLKMFGACIGHQTLNVFNYQQITAVDLPNSSLALIRAFQDQVQPDILAVMSSFAAITLLEAANMSVVGADFASAVAGYPLTGFRAGEVLPAFNAYSYRYIRATRASRNGYKRFSGVSESDVNNGTAAGAIIALLNALETSLAATVIDPVSSVEFAPVIARVTYSGTPAVPTWTYFQIAGVEFRGVTSQTSRKD